MSESVFNTSFSEKEVLEMLADTSDLFSKYQIDNLTTATVAANESNVLANSVEFWKWLDRNYPKSGIFQSNEAMQQYISQGVGKEKWVATQLQGKGYEWDFMTTQRKNPLNIFKQYDAGDIVNRVGSDVSETNLLTQKTTEYQMKAYTSKSNPHLKNTPKDMTVVTNAEKVDIVQNNGYKNTQGFQNNNTINKNKQGRMNQIKSGNAQPTYNLKNITGTMAKAGIVGVTIGVTAESILSYRAWKQGTLTTKEYLIEIAKSGGESGITASATAGIMIPISATITAAGLSSVVTIPIAFVIGGSINKLIAPCFGRGAYRKILKEAKYYGDLTRLHHNLAIALEESTQQYCLFIEQINYNQSLYKELTHVDNTLDTALNDLYDLI